MTAVHYRYATVAGRRLFYREAGPADAPAIVLLHGFPTSSFMFRNLIPVLAQRYRVIAPDHLGFGLSDMPSAGEFTYTLVILMVGVEACAAVAGRIAAHNVSAVRAKSRRIINWSFAGRNNGITAEHESARLRS